MRICGRGLVKEDIILLILCRIKGVHVFINDGFVPIFYNHNVISHSDVLTSYLCASGYIYIELSIKYKLNTLKVN